MVAEADVVCADRSPLLAEVLSRHLSEYDYVKGLQGAKLAWEFLRRCEEYRTDYASYSSLRAGAAGHDCASPAWSEAGGLHDCLCRKWKLYTVPGLADPGAGSIPSFQIYPSELAPILVGLCVDGRKEDYSSGLGTSYPTASFAIHLGRDLEFQFEVIRRMAVSLQRTHGITGPDSDGAKWKGESYPKLVRILDALRAGARLPDIREAFFGRGKCAGDNAAYAIERAEFLARQGYVGLYLLEKPGPAKDRN